MKLQPKWWLKALSIIPKISKEEWDSLDVIAKWLIMTRSAVTTVTVFSSIVAGLLAWRDGTFLWGLWLVATLGLFIAHGTNNILNDYTDYKRGIDTDNYFRAMYGPHPLVHKFHDAKTQMRYFFVSGFLAVLAGLYVYYRTGWDSNILILSAVGAFILLFYTYPMKHFALGEISIFFIWGPVMIGGVYYVLTQQFNWDVILASLPIGLSVMAINLGKHIDKLDEDKAIGVHTLPVVTGEKLARYLNILSLALTYLVIIHLVFISMYFTPVMLLVLLAGKELLTSLKVLSKPKPAEAPPEYPEGAWPVWFAGFSFLHNRRFISLFMLALIIDTLLRIYLPSFW
ncbi:MAG: prenyltransferase [Chloroflexota bacterium]